MTFWMSVQHPLMQNRQSARLAYQQVGPLDHYDRHKESRLRRVFQLLPLDKRLFKHRISNCISGAVGKVRRKMRSKRKTTKGQKRGKRTRIPQIVFQIQ